MLGIEWGNCLHAQQTRSCTFMKYFYNFELHAAWQPNKETNKSLKTTYLSFQHRRASSVDLVWWFREAFEVHLFLFKLLTLSIVLEKTRSAPNATSNFPRALSGFLNRTSTTYLIGWEILFLWHKVFLWRNTRRQRKNFKQILCRYTHSRMSRRTFDTTRLYLCYISK